MCSTRDGGRQRELRCAVCAYVWMVGLEEPGDVRTPNTCLSSPRTAHSKHILPSAASQARSSQTYAPNIKQDCHTHAPTHTNAIKLTIVRVISRRVVIVRGCNDL